MGTMFIAMGGGGDVITATALAADSGGVVVSAAWEKLSVDPIPGPRKPSEMLGTIELSEGLAQATLETRFPNGSLANQARLLKSFPKVPQILIDPWVGVGNLSSLMHFAADKFSVVEAVGVDVGGDVLDGQPSPTLTSPLADALFLAGIWRFDPKSRIVVFGIGLDGEIEETRLAHLLSRWLQNGFVKKTETIDIRVARRIYDLFLTSELSSEVSNLLFRSYFGMCGRVLLRDGGLRVTVGQHSTLGYSFVADDIVKSLNPLPQMIENALSLNEASQILIDAGHRTELDDQIRITQTLQPLIENKDDVRIILIKTIEGLRDRSPDTAVDFVTDRYLAKCIPCSLNILQKELSAVAPELAISISYPYIRI